MIFLSEKESKEYLLSFCPPEIGVSVSSLPFSKHQFPFCIELNDECSRYYYLAKSIVDWMSPFSVSIFLLTEYGIFPSRENRHLIQRLRESYSENKPHFISPGHLFMDFESNDFVTFLHLSLLFGWGGIFASENSKLGFFSHDGWVGLIGEGCDKVANDWI